MKNINIYPEDIIPNSKYMCDSSGRLDLLGQILFTGYGIPIPFKTRTPSDLECAIRNFVVCIRGYKYCDTALSLSLLALDSSPGNKQIEAANKLLFPYGIQLISQSSSNKQVIEPPKKGVVKLVHVTKANLALLQKTNNSWYSCTCSKAIRIDKLIADGTPYKCPECNELIPLEFQNQIIERFQPTNVF